MNPQASSRTPMFWLLVLGVVFLFKQATPVLLPVAISLALMFALTGPVQRLRRWGISEPLGAGLVVALLLLFVAMVGLSLASPATQWLERVPTTLQQLVDIVDRVRDAILQPGSHHNVSHASLAQADALKDKIASEGLLLTRVVIGQVVHFTLSAAATVILLYFLLASQSWLLARSVEACKESRSRLLLLSGLRQAYRDIGLYLRTMAMINVGLGLFTGVALALIGLPNPVLWATVVAIMNFIPYLGPALVTGLLLLGGSMTYGAGSAMFAPPVAFLLGHAIEANLVSPLVMGHRLRLSPLAVFLSVMWWGWIWGFGGTLVAMPILLGFRAFCRRCRTFKHICAYLEGGSKSTPSLRAVLAKHDHTTATRLPARQEHRV